MQVSGQAGPVGTGPFHPEALDGAQAAQPGQQLAVAGRGGGERPNPEFAAPLIQGRYHVLVAVGVCPNGDAPGRRICHCGHNHPFIGFSAI